MEVILAYKYKSGQQLRYSQEINMILTEPSPEGKPGPGKVAGRSRSVSRVKVISENNDGTWTLQMDNEPVVMEGILQGYVPADLSVRGIVFTTDSRGRVVSAPEQVPVPQIPSFPEVALTEGDSWGSPDDPMGITFYLQSIDEKPGEIIANLVSISKSMDPGEGIATDTESTIAFSVTRGCQLQSTTVIEMSWRDGKELSIVLESSLIDIK